MKQPAIRDLLFLTVLVLGSQSVAASECVSGASEGSVSGASEGSVSIDLDFPRQAIYQGLQAEASVGRPSVSPPAAGTLPRFAELAASAADDSTLGLSGAADVSRAIETQAAVAATWTARQQFRVAGQRQLYQLGFYESMKLALDDPLIGEWDYQRGYRAGGRSPEAAGAGTEVGRQDAERVARAMAEGHVTALFLESGRLPSPNPRPTVPLTTTADLKPAVREPRLFDVFDDHPVTEVIQCEDSLRLPDPWIFSRQASAADVYDGGWAEADQAFDVWLSHHHERALWRQLDPSDRSHFSRIFRQIYNHQLSDLFAQSAERAYGRGFDHGWEYGTLIAYEWSFRKGYHDGFARLISESAQASFEDRYPEAYNNLYRRLYRQRSVATQSPAVDTSRTWDDKAMYVDSTPALSDRHRYELTLHP